MEISENFTLQPKFLKIPNINIIHENNKKEIYNKLTEFKTKYPECDLIIMGSSCNIYLDNIVKLKINDIDICSDISKEELSIENIDVLPANKLFIESGYKSRIIEKDGFKFLSKEDVMSTMICSMFKFRKLSTMDYFDILMIDADRDLFFSLVYKIAPYYKIGKYDSNDIKNIISFLKKKYDNSYIEYLKTSEDSFYKIIENEPIELV